MHRDQHYPRSLNVFKFSISSKVRFCLYFAMLGSFRTDPMTGLLGLTIIICRDTREDGPICPTRVIVYKPPAVHPGDVRVFEATWIQGIADAVGSAVYGLVFPAKGARSVPDEIANSDLDGDGYWVC